MRIGLSLLAAIILFAGVGYYRYGVVLAQDNRADLSRRAECEQFAAAAGRTPSAGDTYQSVLRDCNRTAFRTTMSERSIAHYVINVWLWGAIAGLLGGLVTFMVIGRRARGTASAG